MLTADRIEIVGKDDSRYIAWKERSIAHGKELKRGRSIDPLASDYGEAMRELESATFSHLAKTCHVLTERVLITPNTGDPRWGLYHCEEIDFIVHTNGTPTILGEIKHSVSPVYSIMSARRQIQRRLEKARIRWPDLSGLLVCYYLSWLKPPPFEPFATMTETELETRLLNPPPTTFEPRAFIVDANSLIRCLVESSLVLSSFQETLSSRYRASTDPFSELKSNDSVPPSGLLSVGDLFEHTG
ncbi:MAG: hypothetical protein GX456_16645 [Verrucomicrobia bacterium]|nr:hypothetical protein [Verrucomicrobiota bacterium]